MHLLTSCYRGACSFFVTAAGPEYMRIFRQGGAVMKKNTTKIQLTGAVIMACLFLAAPVPAADEQKPAKWDTAGQEVREAAHAVGEATKDSWKDAKKLSAEALEKARVESKAFYLKSREASKKTWEKTKEQGDTSWNTITTESGEAAKKAEEASRKTWEAMQAESKELYDKARKISAQVWESTSKETHETWDTVKDKSKEGLEKVEQGSKKVWEKGRAEMHKATAPDIAAPAANGESAAPPAK